MTDPGEAEPGATEPEPIGSADLTGRLAVVTGGASGIGLATVRALRNAGADVVVADIDQVAGPAAALATGSRYLPLDVTSTADWDRFVGDVEQATGHGGIDIGHLNAGVSGPATGGGGTFLDPVQYRRSMSINVDGVVNGVRALVPALERRGGGHLVVTASLAGIVAFPLDPVYTATKHAVVGLVRSLGPELATRGIVVNAVCPGLTDTPMLGGSKATLEAAGMPLLAPEDIAAAVLGRVRGTDAGQAWICQAGREPVAYRFRGVPGPAGSVRPPRDFADPDA